MRETKNRIFNKILLTIYLAGAINPRVLFFDGTPYCNHVRQRLQKAIQGGYVKEYSYTERYGTHLRDQTYLALTARGVRYLSTCADFPWLQYIPGNIKKVAVFDSPLSASNGILGQVWQAAYVPSEVVKLEPRKSLC